MSGIVLSEVPPTAGETVEEISVPVMESAFVRVKMEPQQHQQQQAYQDQEPMPRIPAGMYCMESCFSELGKTWGRSCVYPARQNFGLHLPQDKARSRNLKLHI